MKQDDERRIKFDDYVLRRYPKIDPEEDRLFINTLYEAYLMGCKDATNEYNETLNKVLKTINRSGGLKDVDE